MKKKPVSKIGKALIKGLKEAVKHEKGEIKLRTSFRTTDTKPTINVTEQQLAKCWDEFVLPRSEKIILDSQESAAFKSFVKKLRYLNEV